MPQQQEPLFDLVIYGIDAADPRFLEGRAKVARLLNVAETDVQDALGMGSRVVTAGMPEELAQQGFKDLRALGVQCNLRPSTHSGRTLSLAPMSLEREFTCPRCQHEHVYQRAEQPPTMCLGCGLVFAKYDRAQLEHEERERLRRSLLAQKDHDAIRELKERQQREAQERRIRMEEELRKELGIPKAMASRRALIGTAVAVLVVGIGVGIGAARVLAQFGTDERPTAGVVMPNNSTEGSTEAVDPGLNAHRIVAAIESAPSSDVARPGDLNSLSGSRTTPKGNLDALKIDALYAQQVATRTDALFAVGQVERATQLLAQSVKGSANQPVNTSQAIRRGSAAALQRARSSGDANSVAPTFEALANTAAALPADADSRIGDLAHVARRQLDAGLAEGATTQLERLRQWAAQSSPAAKVEAQGEIGQLLTRLGRQDEAKRSFMDANAGIGQIGDRATRLHTLVRLARAYADAGNQGAAAMLIEDATLSAGRIVDPAKRIAVLQRIAEFHAESGNAQAALQVTATLDNANLRADAELLLVTAFVDRNRLGAATEVADVIAVPEYRARALGRLSAAQTLSTNALFRDLAPVTLRLAHAALANVDAAVDHAMILSELARVATLTGDASAAASDFTEAERLAAAIEAQDTRNLVYSVIAGNMIRAQSTPDAKHTADAQRLAELIADPIVAGNLTDDIAAVLASAGATLDPIPGADSPALVGNAALPTTSAARPVMQAATATAR